MGMLKVIFIIIIIINPSIILSPAPDDYSSVSGSFDMTDVNSVQCIPIPIISDNTTEIFDECFTFSISATYNVAGLSLNPTTAIICISDRKEQCKYFK